VGTAGRLAEVMMKPIEEQTYYEILEVTPNATAKEIHQAYEHAKETFNDDSVAIYSLFSEEEIRKIQVAIEEAYRVLLEEALRKSGDHSLAQMPDKQRWEKPSELGTGPKEVINVRETTDTRVYPPLVKFPAHSAGHRADVPVKEIPGGVGVEDYRGKKLKQIRERMGIELQAVSAETKIGPKILQSIEEEAFGKLPALVYLKGFLRSYAQSLGLDPTRVIEGYLRFLNENKGK
jgi:hypothetical protein